MAGCTGRSSTPSSAGGARFGSYGVFKHTRDLDREGRVGLPRRHVGRNGAGAAGPGLHERLYRRGQFFSLRRRLVPVRSRIIATEELAPEMTGPPDAEADDDERGTRAWFLLPPFAGRQAHSAGRPRQLARGRCGSATLRRERAGRTFSGVGEGSPFPQLVWQCGDAPRHAASHLREGRAWSMPPASAVRASSGRRGSVCVRPTG